MPPKALVAVGNPAKAGVMNPLTWDRADFQFIRKNGLSQDPVGQLVFLIYACARFDWVANSPPLVEMFISHEDPANAGHYIQTDLAGVAALGVGGDLTQVKLDAYKDRAEWYTNSRGAVNDFIANMTLCQQVKAMGQDNVENGLRSQGLNHRASRTVLAIIEWTAGALARPDLGGMAAHIHANPFLTYHTAASSVGSLYQLVKACFELPVGRLVAGAGGVVFGPVESAALDAAAAAPWDYTMVAAIPPPALAKMHWILEGSGRLPRNWYLGRRNQDFISDAKAKAIVAYMKRQTEISTLVSGVAAAADPAALAAHGAVIFAPN